MFDSQQQRQALSETIRDLHQRGWCDGTGGNFSLVLQKTPLRLLMAPSGIEKRNIKAERVIQASYLDDLRRRYYKLWRGYTEAPVYVLDTTQINYIDSQADRDYMINMLDGWLEEKPINSAPQAYSGENSTQMSLFNLRS